jgi:hypothetical protein
MIDSPFSALRPTAWKTIRTIVTSRGTRFDVFAETDHFVMCHEPVGNTDTVSDAILDFEDMATRGYWLCHIRNDYGAHVMFEKRGTT